VEVEPTFIGKLNAVMEAGQVNEIQLATQQVLSALGLGTMEVSFGVSGVASSLSEASDSQGLISAHECSSGGVTAKLLLPKGAIVDSPEVVRVVLQVAAQRLRTVSGEAFDGRIETSEFVAADPVTQSLLSTLRDFAVLDGINQKLKHICLVGERGVGKEGLAKLIHKWSGRAEKPLVTVNFGAISKELAAAELFGARKGSYTGCNADRQGLIQRAEGGTLFLDELDEASESLQAMIKRAVQFGVFNVVGEAAESKANTRFVAATNVVDVESLKIKRDLKDRFLLLRVPPLRERRGDIRPLAEKFASEYRFALPEPVLVFLERLDWPGNVRQLQNVIERSCAIAGGSGEITLDLIHRSARDDGAIDAVTDAPDFKPLRTGESLEMRLEYEERRLVMHALESCNGHKIHAANALGISRQGLYTRLKKFGLRD
jgi:DNA-binding NtrC family response regulator